MTSLADEAAGALSGLERTEAGFRARFRLDPGASVLAGHFPGHPVVPGVYLIEAVASAARTFGLGPLRGVRQAKFLREVAPGATVELEGTLVAERGLEATLLLDGQKAATISLDFAASA